MNNERAAFEAWMLSLRPSDDLERDKNGEYVIEWVENSWYAWQARAELDGQAKEKKQ